MSVVFHAWRHVGAALLWFLLTLPSHAGTNAWTTNSGACPGPYSTTAAGVACFQASYVILAPFQRCGIQQSGPAGTTNKSYFWRELFDNVGPPYTCDGTFPASYDGQKPISMSFTDACSSMSPPRAYDATYTGCAQICVAPDTLNTTTGLCQPENVPPTAPTDLSAAPASSGAITLTWAASTDNVAVTGYAVERCMGAACNDFAEVATTASTTRHDSGLVPNTTYRYRVRAFDAAGNHSAYSSVTEATTDNATVYAYDELGRLALITIPSGASIVYSYDESGNVTAIVRAAP